MANSQAGDAADLSAASGFDGEQFVLDEVLQLVVERALAITNADGVVIALAENEEIVSRAASGSICPDIGTPIDCDSGFSGACFKSAQIWRCDDTEADTRVNLQACRRLGARSIVAVPLRGRRHTIGLLEAFSVKRFGFSDSHIINLRALADLVVGAMDPDEEDCFAESAQQAATKLKMPLSALDALPITSEPPEGGQIEPASAEPGLANSFNREIATPSSTLHIPGRAAEKTSSKFGLSDDAEAVAKSATITEKLAASPRRSGNSIWLMFIFMSVVVVSAAWWRLQTHIGSISQQDTTLSPSHTIDVPTKAPVSQRFARVTGIRHRAAVDSSTVVIELQDRVQYEAHRLSGPDRIYVDLHNTKLSSELPAKPIEVRDPVLKHIRIGQPAVGTTRIVLVTKDHTEFSVRLEPNPYQLVIELKKSGEITGSH